MRSRGKKLVAVMNPRCEELIAVLRDARALIALPDNKFDHSSWTDSSMALTELDQLIAALTSNHLPPRLRVSVLFAPTGPIQEVSLSSGWGNEFLKLANRFDRAEELAYLEVT